MRAIADQKQISGMVDALAEALRTQVRAHDADGAPWALVGIRSRGDVLASRIRDRLGGEAFGDRVGVLDITLYRDDLSEASSQPLVRTTEIPFAIDGVNVVLVDDVLMTGRSIRAALQSLMDLGRPRRVWLAVLVDRGGRELPIAPDLVALDLTKANGKHAIKPGEYVEVRLTPTDPQDGIFVQSPATGRKGDAAP
jgi:pyrimidine operon attenuation protein/uracil phosphoribosyltransferase